MNWELILRIAVWYLLFAGLSEGVRTFFRVDRYIAPFVTASSVILVLMVAGMAGVLRCGVWLLYIAGCVGWVYALRRQRPDGFTLMFGGLLLAFLIYNLNGVRCTYWDDFSHWMTVADSLVRRNAFPDASEPLVLFRSYPVGMASFLYYVQYFVRGGEETYMIAQNFLSGIMLYTMFAMVQKKNVLTKMLMLVFVTVLFFYGRALNNLQVDWLLGHAGIAIFAAVCSERKSMWRALGVALPGMLAVVLIKNSGMFFAMIGTVTLMLLYGKRERYWKVLLVSILAVLGTFVLWRLHLAVAFPDGTDGWHSVSIARYADTAQKKSFGFMIEVAAHMIRSIWEMGRSTVAVFAVMGISAVFTVVRTIVYRDDACVRACKGQLLGIGVLVLWLIMLWLTYIVDMSESQARNLVSFNRYFCSGMISAMGIAIVSNMEWANGRIGKEISNLWRVAWIGIVLAVVLMNGAKMLKRVAPVKMSAAQNQLLHCRDIFAKAPSVEEGKYCAYFGDGVSVSSAELLRYIMRADLQTMDVTVLIRANGEDSFSEYSFEGRKYIEDISAWMKENAEKWDGFFILDKNRDDVAEEAYRFCKEGTVFD